MREDGYETIMVNCNPETVSTDYDTSDRLYFEPVTLEDVLEIVRIEQPKGVIVQFGGQTPLKLARALWAEGVPVIGTTPDAIDCAEDRERFQQMIEKLGLLQPPNAIVRSAEQAEVAAERIGYPLVVRPSYVLGGRAMEIVYRPEELRTYMREAVRVSDDSPILLDYFLKAAVEVDIDAVCDGERVVIRDHDGTRGALSVAALDKVMTRYGRELEAGAVLDGDALTIPGGYRLRRFRFHAVVDAEGRDYLVWERPDGEPLAVIATMVTSALRYLVLRLAIERPVEGS
jgi:hypothetical protein